MDLTIAIPCCRETRLERTINRIKATCPDLPEISIVFDGDRARNYAIDYPGELLQITETPEQVGTSAARDLAIMAATRSTIFNTDAHVDWWDGDDWAQRLLHLSNTHPDDVLCCKMRSMDINHMYLRTDQRYEVAYTGATLALRIQEHHSKTVLAAKWETQKEGIIPICMGASYTFKRLRYIEQLRRPWRINQGWGLDEETISLVNWICGGETRLVDVEIGHPCDLKKYPIRITSTQSPLWTNRMSLLEYLPMSRDLRTHLDEWVRRAPYIRKYGDDARGMMKQELVADLKLHLSRQSRLLDQFITTFNCTDRIDNPAQGIEDFDYGKLAK